MIPKVMAGDDFCGVHRYLTHGRVHDVIEPQGVPLDSYVDAMEMVARQNSRCTKPVKHVTFSAAIEDGRLPDAMWLELIDEAAAELGLSNHQRIIIRHRDKPYDHVHVVWCAVSVTTGRTPKLQFRTKDAPFPEVGPRALSRAQVAQMRPDQVKRKSYDAHALLRLQHLCRSFEGRHRLRRLATPEGARDARQAGRVRNKHSDVRREQRHRNDRTGDSLLGQTDAVRTALAAPDWDQRSANLATLGLGVRPFLVPSKNGPRLRGIVIYDLANEQNAVAASAFDSAGIKHGMAALDKRGGPGMPSFAEWWEQRPIAPAPHTMQHIGQKVHYDQARTRHVTEEARRATEREQIAQRYRLKEQALRKRLMAHRRTQAEHMSVNQRRLFYAAFDDTVRQPQLDELHERRRAEMAAVARSRMPSFAEWRRRMTLLVAALHSDRARKHDDDQLPRRSLHRLQGMASIPRLASAPPLSQMRGSRGIRLLGDQRDETTVGALPAVKPAPHAMSHGINNVDVIARFDVPIIIGHNGARTSGGQARHPIDGYIPRPVADGVVYAKPGQPTAFIDQGTQIAVRVDSDDALRAALKLALARIDGTIVVFGDASVVKRIERIADELGARGRLAVMAGTRSVKDIGVGLPQARASLPPPVSTQHPTATVPERPARGIRAQAELAVATNVAPATSKGPKGSRGGLPRNIQADHSDPGGDDSALAVQQALTRRGEKGR